MAHTLNVGFRSPLVTASAWFVIVFAAAGAALVWISPLVAALFPAWALRGSGLPWLIGVVLEHLPWVLVLATVLAVALLACATGLLLRLEWARRLFIALLAIVAAAHLPVLWLQHEVVSVLLESTLRLAAMPPPAAGVVGGFALLTQALGIVLTLGACALLIWVMWALMSERVRREFI